MTNISPGACHAFKASSLCYSIEDGVAVQGGLQYAGGRQGGSMLPIELGQLLIKGQPAVWQLADVVGVPAPQHQQQIFVFCLTNKTCWFSLAM